MNILNKLQQFSFVRKSLTISNTPFSMFGVECGEGWENLLLQLCQDLENLEFDGNVLQIKEKFGGLRFYIDSGCQEVYNRIDVAESESYKICEICGAPGKLSTKGWHSVRCSSHIEK
jgi:hypothetical protein